MIFFLLLYNFNQELEEQIKELKEDKKSQVERFKKIQSNNTLLENKLEQIQKEASRFSGKQIQVKEQEGTPVKKQTTKTPYRHPNHKNHFDQ